MRFNSLPTWIYWPAKIVLILILLSPLFFWVRGHIKLPESFSDHDSGNHKFSAGIDVSHYQGIINWKKVAKAELSFVYTKATSGITYVDPHFKHNWNGIRSTEMFRGAYHFFLATDDPQLQAENFIRTVGALRNHDMPPMLDVEILDHSSRSAVETGALAWLQAVEEATGRIPIIYTGSSFGTQILTNPDFSKYPLWIAEYSDHIKSIPKPWKHAGWTIWQYSSTSKVEGITGHVDMNRFHSDTASLEQFIKHSHKK